MDESDDLTFRVNLGGDGVSKLQLQVKDKLKEFMGDYTDDALVEYVIVLLKNGRRKVEAKKELDVFLGDDSDCFVSWLWDHLGQHLDLYVQPSNVLLNEVAKAKSTVKEQPTKIDTCHVDAEQKREKPNKLSRSRHRRQWKGIKEDAVETIPLHSMVTSNTRVDEDVHMKVDHLKLSPSLPILQRKRHRPDERIPMKQDEVFKTITNAPRRLLQVAVRDALGSPKMNSLGSEPSLKRIRSVVSASAGYSSLGDRAQRIQSVARVPNASMEVAIKAVAEAAKDAGKIKSSGNVFNRLGCGTDELDTSEHIAKFMGSSAEAVEENGSFDYFSEEIQPAHHQLNEFNEGYSKNRTSLESYAGVVSDVVSDNELYMGGHIRGHKSTVVSDSGVSVRNKDDDSLMVQYNVAGKAVQSTSKPRKDEYQSVAADASSKIVNISVNVNTWKPSQYQEVRELSAVTCRKFVHESEAGAGKSNAQLMKENSGPFSAGTRNAISVEGQRESQKSLSSTVGSHSTGHLVEDANSRTIFVSNVHFAATKDSLSRHFNKFGDVLKVIIVTDATTGQPKGSAYVEFMKREAADHALSLDGTSFLSRILKVVKKSAAPQEAAIMTSPQISRGSIFSAPRFGRVPFPRGIPSPYQVRPPMKAGGARSFQWKRDAQMATVTSGVSNNIQFPNTSRSLTYVRPEAKTNGNSSTV
ncbi:Polyadenylate-binding protein 2-A [Heracleum sosnowskyi]|uniref:Polyadenylate-binding protein 2-A n=1 Tax=Heracleum sosnowskyi TaxID=360622 RepID=A0AAD8MFB5_9APIA|nr:Polyadenylate-binding protein 2-A [Heracleum sosnowskyi]